MTIRKPSPDAPVLLQLLPALRSGGVERGTIDIANAAAKAGFISLVASEGGGMESRLTAGAEHIHLPLDTKNWFQLKKNAQAIEQIIRERGVNIVHARSRGPAWSAYWATRNTGTPFVTTFHGVYGLDLPFKRLYNSVMTRGDRVIAVSQFVADHIRDNYGLTATELQKVKVIHRGVDLDIFNREAMTTERILGKLASLNIPDDLPIIMLPGRITEWKGHVLLLKALNELPHRNFYCLMVGDDKRDGAYRRKLTRLINQYHFRNNVRVVGNIPDIASAYMLSDVVVSASTKPEAFGRVMAEAQAMGRMVVATNHGGSRETIISGKTGWLVEPNNPKALADAINEAINLTKDERAEKADAAIEQVRAHFSLEKMCSQTLEVYHDVLREAPVRSQAPAHEEGSEDDAPLHTRQMTA
ncbi:MAG: cotSA [Rickettsiales bacterium]|jgi:glycosyltransferase involved in cell wall biosynthesis|nr:cotSA [Rickettsiales bacterium]